MVGEGFEEAGLGWGGALAGCLRGVLDGIGERLG